MKQKDEEFIEKFMREHDQLFEDLGKEKKGF